MEDVRLIGRKFFATQGYENHLHASPAVPYKYVWAKSSPFSFFEHQEQQAFLLFRLPSGSSSMASIILSELGDLEKLFIAPLNPHPRCLPIRYSQTIRPAWPSSVVLTQSSSIAGKNIETRSSRVSPEDPIQEPYGFFLRNFGLLCSLALWVQNDRILALSYWSLGLYWSEGTIYSTLFA